MNRRVLAIGLGTWLAAGGIAAAQTDDLPQRKAGLWQVNMTMPGGPMPPQQMKMCIDTNTDADMQKMGMNASQSACSKPDIKRSGNTVTVNSVCKMGTTQATTHVVTNFTGETAYHSDITTKFEPPIGGRDQQAMAQDATWTGPCPADMQPGDVVMGNGMKMNMKQMMGARPKQ